MSTHSAIQNLRRRTQEGAELGPVEVTEPPEAATAETDSAEAEGTEAGAADAGQKKGRKAKPVPIETPQQLARKTNKARQDAERPGRRQRLREKIRQLAPAIMICVPFFLAAVLLFGILAPAFSDQWVRWLLAPGIFAAATLAIAVVLTRRIAPKLKAHMTEDADAAVIRASYDAMGSPRSVFGPDGKMIYANKAFVTLLRRYRGSGTAGLEAALGGDRTGLEEFARVCDLASRGIPAQAELEMHDTAGNRVWRRINAMPLEEHRGYFALRLEDTSSDSHLIRRLRDEQQTFSAFFETAPIGFYSADENGRLVYMNSTLTEWLGVSPKDIADGWVQLHNHIVTNDATARLPYDPFGNGSGIGEMDVVLRDMRGRQFPAQIIQRVERNSSGDLRTRSIVRDLTPERMWQQTIEKTEAKIERLLADSPVGVAVLSGDATVRECNATLQLMLGPEGHAVDGLAFAQLINPEARDEFIESFGAVLAGHVSAIPVEVHPFGNTNKVYSIYLSSFGAEDDEERGVFVHCLDMSDQRHLEQQIAHSTKMQAVGQLAGGVAHDFNNLLTAMIGYCDLLLMRHRPGEQSFADITQIKQNANRAADLVRQLLAFSRQQTLKPRVLRITDVLTDISHLLRRLVGSNVTLTLTHGRDTGKVRADQGQLEQVVMNLVVNARDAMKDGGTVEIRTNGVNVPQPIQRETDTLPAGQYVLIEVIDQGTGITKENLARIFDPFFTTKKQGEGTGLGLSTVYGIVKQTGGHLFVDSVIGRGTKFSIYLPMYHPAPGEELAEQSAVRGGLENVGRDLTGAGTVMLVEDEEAVRQFSARALRNKGYTVLEEGTGQTAFQALMNGKGDEIQLLITDIMMPDMDGTALIREVTSRWPHIKIICISGYAEDTFREKIDKAEDVYFLPKPFNLSQLAGLVKDVFAGTAQS